MSWIRLFSVTDFNDYLNQILVNETLARKLFFAVGMGAEILKKQSKFFTLEKKS